MPFSSRVMTIADWKKLKWFEPHEFRHPQMMGLEFMIWLDQVREDADVPMVITSDFRSKEYNASIGGATDSAHSDVPCNSIDVGKRPRKDDPSWNYTRYRIFEAARKNGCVRIGMYPDGSMHLDRTEDRRPAPRIWIAVR